MQTLAPKRISTAPLMTESTLAGLLLAFALLSSAMNIVPLIPVSLLAFLGFAVGRWLISGKSLLPRGPAKSFGLYLILSMIYCQLIGVSLLDPELYRRELKYIFPFTAFMIVSSLDFEEKLDGSIVLILESLVVISIIFVFVSLVFINQDLHWLYPFDNNMWASYGSSFLYSGQFLDHSAFGGFLCTLFLIIFGIFRWSDYSLRRKIVLLFEMAVLLALLYFSRSRAFLVASIVVVVMSTFFYHIRSALVRGIFIFGILLGAVIGIQNIAANILQFQDLQQELSEEDSVADYNVLARYILWGIAANDFIQSPLIGVGISRFDDNYVVLATFPGYENLDAVPKDPEYWGSWPFRVEVDPFAAHTDQHAHNAYLHVLAEGGLLFFSIAAWMFYKALSALRISARAALGPERGLRMGICYAFFGVFVGSLFGNNLFTIIPMYMVLSLTGYVVARSYSGGPAIR